MLPIVGLLVPDKTPFVEDVDVLQLLVYLEVLGGSASDEVDGTGDRAC